jgi:EAL domain-containing protein (putative c-di-GMP-specific phosphodiesterase class I)
VYDVSLDEHSVGRLALMGDLREALEADALHLNFQPKVLLSDETCVGVEVLLRWRHHSFGQIPPDQIIPLAEQTGLIQTLTYWVLDKALEQCAAWRQQGLDLPVAVNLSVLNLQDENLPQRVRESLERHHLTARDLVLEITESAMMANPASSMENLTLLHQMGIPLTIDDFGTGFSSLAYLKNLPVSELKLDKSFIIGLCAGAEDEVIVRSTIELAHNLGLRVVAEGVETDVARDLLISFGCDLAQGYFYSRPVEGDRVMGWVTSHNEHIPEPLV